MYKGHFISYILYFSVLGNTLDSTPLYYWERDLNNTLPPNDWNKIWQVTFKTS